MTKIKRCLRPIVTSASGLRHEVAVQQVQLPPKQVISAPPSSRSRQGQFVNSIVGLYEDITEN